MTENAAPSTDPASEAELVERLRSRDDAAFEEVIRRHGGPLLATARRFLRNEEDANEAIQDAFLSFHRGIDRFQAQSRLSTWLHRIVVNAALMKLRSKRARPEGSIEELLPQFADAGHHRETPRPWSGGSVANLARDEVRLAVRTAIDRLPDSYRTVLLLRDIEELDTEETSRILGVTPNAVKVRLHRARQALRTLIDPHLREPLS